MSTDLERDLRAALRTRADAVTPQRLRHPDTARRRARTRTHSRRALVAPIAAAACVAIVVLVALTATGVAGNSGRASAGHGPTAPISALLGTSWSLESVREDGGSTVPIPQNVSASITFESGGVLDAQDGANAYRASYAFTTATEMLIAEPTARTAGGSVVGQDRAAAASARAIHAILYDDTGQPTAHPVTVSRSGGELNVAANGYTLTFTGEVPVATTAPPAPVPTGPHS